MTKKENKIVVVLGMHRSGTSYVAAVLHHLGVSMGEQLLDADWSNQNGHFEDLDILQINKAILIESNIETYTSSINAVSVSDSLQDKATAIIEQKKSRHQYWGWKDPRTALTIDFWAPLIGSFIPVIVYRHYQTVVRSLLKREYHQRFVHIPFYRRFSSLFNRSQYINEGNSRANHFLASWIHHHERMFSASKFLSDAIVLPMDAPITWTTNDLAMKLKAKGLELSEPEIFDWQPNDLSDPGFDFDLDPELRSKADEIILRLESLNRTH